MKDLEIVIFCLLWSVLYFAPFGLFLLYFAQKCVDFSGRKFPGKGRKYPGRLSMTETSKHEVVSFFLTRSFLFQNGQILKIWSEI